MPSATPPVPTTTTTTTTTNKTATTTTTNKTATTTTTNTTAPPPPLPSPSTFDILPPLHALLSRLLLPPTAAPHPSATPITSSPHPSNANTALSPKDLATAASAVKIKIQKARVAVQRLPDADRSVQEQELELAELEAEVRRLRGLLGGVRAAARDAVAARAGVGGS